MKKTHLAALLFLTFALPSVSLAKSGPHVGEVKTPVHKLDALDQARANYSSAQAACGRATAKYNDKVFNAGGHDAEEIRSRGQAKASACNQATGALTALLNVLKSESANYGGEIKLKEAELAKAPKDKQAEIKTEIADLKREQLAIDKEIAKYPSANGDRLKH